jgi:hypothetical protein
VKLASENSYEIGIETQKGGGWSKQNKIKPRISVKVLQEKSIEDQTLLSCARKCGSN